MTFLGDVMLCSSDGIIIFAFPHILYFMSYTIKGPFKDPRTPKSVTGGIPFLEDLRSVYVVKN